MGLRKVYRTIGLTSYANSQEILKVPLDCYVELGPSDLFDDFIDLGLIWSCQNRIIGVQ